MGVRTLSYTLGFLQAIVDAKRAGTLADDFIACNRCGGLISQSHPEQTTCIHTRHMETQRVWVEGKRI
jgi:hypothetical protein